MAEQVYQITPTFVPQDRLVNFKNYYVYADMVRNRSSYEVYVPEDLTINNIDEHIDGIFNILKDGIETDFIANCKIRVRWENTSCRLSIVDYWYSLFMWCMILKTGHEIRPKHIFLGSKSNISEVAVRSNRIFPWQIQRKDIRSYVDKYILTLDNKINFMNNKLNEIIADGLWRYSYIEHFAYYLANTINNEDDIDLMRASKEFDDLYHCDLSNTQFDKVKEAGMEITYKAMDIIKDSEYYLGYEHGLTNSFRANEAVNPRQYQEASFNIGTKPNGAGGIYPYIINKSFKTGGVNDPLSYFIESSGARFAQILSKTNVGESGNFARLLGINNTDTILNLDPNYECMSQHYIKYNIKSKKHLSLIKNRYYRFNPRGIDYCIDQYDESLVGKTVYLHSPMTCASNSAGHGICKRCYGDLFWTNSNINIGKIAAEILSAQLTQTLLSAKHLLETKIVSIVWNPEFKDFFDIDINSIKLLDGFDENDLRRYTMIIDPDQVQLANDEEDTVSFEDEDGESISMSDSEDSGVYNEYITSFAIKYPDGSEIQFGSTEQNELYISDELNKIIRKKAYASEGKVAIPLAALEDNILFYIKINNNEISKTMNDIINIINKSSVTESMTKDETLQSIVDLVIDGGLTIDSVHLEVILSNQIVDPEDITRKPNWNNPHALYRMFTLNQALTNNPSVIISLLYKDLHKVLYNPLTFTKHAPSFFDLFFHEQPQVYMNSDLLTDDTSNINNPDEGVQMYKLVEGGMGEEKFMAKIKAIQEKEEAAKKKDNNEG